MCGGFLLRTSRLIVLACVSSVRLDLVVRACGVGVQYEATCARSWERCATDRLRSPSCHLGRSSRRLGKPARNEDHEHSPAYVEGSYLLNRTSCQYPRRLTPQHQARIPLRTTPAPGEFIRLLARLYLLTSVRSGRVCSADLSSHTGTTPFNTWHGGIFTFSSSVRPRMYWGLIGSMVRFQMHRALDSRQRVDRYLRDKSPRTVDETRR